MCAVQRGIGTGPTLLEEIFIVLTGALDCEKLKKKKKTDQINSDWSPFAPFTPFTFCVSTHPKDLHLLQRQLLHAGWILGQNNDFLHGALIWIETLYS